MITELNGVVDAIKTLESHATALVDYWIMMDELLGETITGSGTLNGENMSEMTMESLINAWEKAKANHLRYQQDVSRSLH